MKRETIWMLPLVFIPYQFLSDGESVCVCTWLFVLFCMFGHTHSGFGGSYTVWIHKYFARVFFSLVCSFVAINNFLLGQIGSVCMCARTLSHIQLIQVAVKFQRELRKTWFDWGHRCDTYHTNSITYYAHLTQHTKTPLAHTLFFDIATSHTINANQCEVRTAKKTCRSEWIHV